MRVFAIDYRSLALFRMAVGLAVLYSITTIAAVANMLLAKDGFLTLREIENYHRRTWSWSVAWISDATWFQYSLLLFAAVAATCLVVGWRTRVATVLTWVLFSSIHMRVTPVIGGGDILLNLLLFWGMFLPLGARWSVDAGSQAPPLDESLLSAGSAAILVQMAMMYLFTGISKFNSLWLDGSALGIGFSIDRVTRPLGRLLAEYPWLTAQISRGTLVAELLLPFVLFSPWKTNWCRSFALLMLLAFHVGIEATMIVAMFSFASITGLTLFIPASWWQLPPLRQLQTLLDKFWATSQASLPKHSPKSPHTRNRKLRGSAANVIWRLIGNAVVAALLLYVLFYNVLVGFASAELRASLGAYQRLGELLVLKQYWDMFSDPSSNCNEIACVARLQDGTQIDLLRNHSAVTDRTAFPSQPAKYDSMRKMIWASVVTNPNVLRFLKGYLEYECRKYSETEGDPTKRIVDCSLMYYPYIPNPYAKNFSFAELERLQLGRR